MFCSQECVTIGKRFHQFECKIELNTEIESDVFQMIHRMVFEAIGLFGNVEALKDFMETKKMQTQKTIFDFNLSTKNDNERERNLLMAINSTLQRNSIPEQLNEVMERHCDLMMSILEAEEKHKQFLSDFMKRQMEILITNAFGLVENGKEIGSGIFPLASFFNHSCASNVARITVDGQLVFIVTRPIKKNNQLFVCYRGDFLRYDRDERQNEILKSYGFLCKCEACEGNYENLNKLSEKQSEKVLEKNLSENSSSVDSMLSSYENNCTRINEIFLKYPSYEICHLIDRNQKLLNKIVYLTSSSSCLERD